MIRVTRFKDRIRKFPPFQPRRDYELEPYITLSKEVLIRAIKDFIYALKACGDKSLLEVGLSAKYRLEKAKRNLRKNNTRKAHAEYKAARRWHELMKNGLVARRYIFSDSYQCEYQFFNSRSICKLIGLQIENLRRLLKEIEEDPDKLAALFKNQKYYPARRRYGLGN